MSKYYIYWQKLQIWQYNNFYNYLLILIINLHLALNLNA